MKFRCNCTHVFKERDIQQSLTLPLSQGFTLIELFIAVAIAGLIAAVGIPFYQDYVDKARNSKALADIGEISLNIEKFVLINARLPDSLADIGENRKDPWDKLYAYYNVQENGKGGARKDKNLTPINSDYDLYSAGKDGVTARPLTPKRSHDDVIRANNGGYFGLGEDY